MKGMESPFDHSGLNEIRDRVQVAEEEGWFDYDDDAQGDVRALLAVVEAYSAFDDVIAALSDARKEQYRRLEAVLRGRA